MQKCISFVIQVPDVNLCDWVPCLLHLVGEYMGGKCCFWTALEVLTNNVLYYLDLKMIWSFSKSRKNVDTLKNMLFYNSAKRSVIMLENTPYNAVHE